MNKYEIMLVVDPAIDNMEATKLIESVFDKKNVKKVEKLEQTTLAYPINKSSKAQFMFYLIEAERSLIAEFIRRSNITKFIWRHLVINLDAEKGLNRSKKVRKNVFNKDAKVIKGTVTKKLVDSIEKVSKAKNEKPAKKPATKNQEESK